MARPRLSELERREHSTRADLTLAEKHELTRKRKLASMSEAELLRTFIRDGEVIVQGGGRSDPALVTEINRLALQLRKAGVTANKLAMATHMEREFRGRWQEIADELDAVCADAAELLKRVV